MVYETLLYDVADGILTLTLNRPDQLNAFTVQMADELEAAFRPASTDDDVRACTKPVIAAVNGPAVGIGATMLCAMDVRLASEMARIGLVFGVIGITPEAASTWFLPRIVGISQALEWVYSAEILTADAAMEGGLVRSVHAPEELLDAAYALARKFTENRSPVATALARQIMYRNSAAPHPLVAHQVDSLAIFYQSIGDGKEGVRSFVEKREPDFTSRTTEMPPFYPWW